MRTGANMGRRQRRASSRPGASHTGARVVVGDRVCLGEIELVVKETEGKAITKVGLLLHRTAPRNAGQ